MIRETNHPVLRNWVPPVLFLPFYSMFDLGFTEYIRFFLFYLPHPWNFKGEIKAVSILALRTFKFVCVTRKHTSNLF